MKNKPHRHKETNVFKFIPFSERIGNVKIDVIHQVKHKYELEAEQTSTHLYKAYEKWILLSSSESFMELKQDISYNIQILPQILARKEELVSVLKKHLSAKNPLNLQPTLEFVVALANDLRQEFYPYFPSIYELLMSLLDSKDVDQLEWVFQCLAFLFKLLWRYLINDLTNVFESLIPLLDKSKPSYINNFAAQSFAFVVRKVKDDSKLIKLIIRTIKDKPQAVEGCGRLVFEIVKGVQGQWHSCGEKIFTSLVYALRDPAYPHSILSSLLTEALSHLLEFLSFKEHILLLWKILQNVLSDIWKDSKDQPTERNIANTEQVLCMIQQSIEYRQCAALVEPTPLLRQLLELLRESEVDMLTSRICSIISYVLLNASKLPQELSSSTVIGALGCLEGKTLLEFALQIRNYTGFEGIVLPRLLTYCLDSVLPEVALPYLARLVVSKAPPAEDSRQFLVYQPYSINFSSVRKGDPATYGNFYLSVLKERSIKEHLERFDDCIMILQLLPHLLPLPKAEAVSVVVSLLESACSEISASGPEVKTKLLYMMSASMEAAMCLKPEQCITKLVPPPLVLPILMKHASEGNLFVLRVLDFYVTLDELNLLQPFAEELKTNLYPQLMSPYSKVRLHSTHILYEIEKSNGSNELMSSVFETCWSAECIPPTLSDYRQRLKVLQKLDTASNETLKDAITKGTVDGKVPLRYLLGHLFINFKLLWEPVKKIVVSYSQAMDTANFWEVYRGQMESVALEICEQKQQETREPFFVCEEFEKIFSDGNDLKEKPDYVKYRIMLWEMLKEFPDTIYEGKSKDIVICFFKFLEEEYNKRYSEAAPTWDIRLKGGDHLEDMSMQEAELLMEVDEEVKEADNAEEVIGEEVKEADNAEEVINESGLGEPMDTLETSLDKHDNSELSPSKDDSDLKKELTEEPLPETEWKTKWLTKSLVAHMGIFGKMRSPKSLYREAELNKIFYEFLSSRVKDVQKCALDFIMQYKMKYLTPYKDNVYGLIDDKTFKSELTLFRVDTQSDVVRPEHRANLIPIILRIVHSKMYSKVSSSKRETRQARKAAILRFLSGCTSEELFNFFKMAFSHFIALVEDNAFEMVSKLTDSFDLEHCTPPRRLTATAYLLKTVLTYCGGLLDQEQISLLLRLILIVSAHPPAILSKREEVHPGYVKVVKNVRAVCFYLISQFYEVYEDYKWSEEAIEAVFKVLVWPYLHNMSVEAVNSPTAQFKLFNVWSKNPKHFTLFEKKDKEGRSVLSSIVELWGSPKLHGSVHNTLLELVHRLLAEEDEEVQETVSGKKILSDYIPKILKLLQDKLTARKSLTKKELQVLSLITSSPAENVSSECLLSFVLPSLLKSFKKDDETITQMLTTANNLMRGVAEPGPYLRQVVPLFSSLSAPQHRKLLLNLVLYISEHSGSPLDHEILLDLTAWDAKWVDQPDFTRRLKAFTTLDQPTLEPTVLMTAVVIHTAFHYLKEEKDLSLKDNARHCLRTLCPRVCSRIASDKAELNYLLDATLFPLVLSGINGNIEHLRQEAILILGHLVRECSSLHYVLSDLFPLSNKTDLEVDFFENLVHLQLHRRVRAMLRFSEISENTELSWNPRTLMNFVYPMISHFLLSLKYAEKNTIIDSAIKAIGSICRLLNWKYYSVILRNYLQKLKSGTEFQKQTIRIVSEILNAFHFNLSEAGNFNNVGNVQSAEKTVEEDSTMPEEKEVTEEGEDLVNDEKVEVTMRDQPLSKPVAEKVVKELAGVILPSLQSLMAHKNVADSYHKVNKKAIAFERDEEDMMRAPLAIAIVKLLQKLPSPALLKRNLPGILMKLCTLLKSHGESVRRTARTTLETVMVSLGPKYLPTLLSELTSLLTRGFQVHVLAYTVHGVLKALSPMYAEGDMDNCVHLALEVCTADLFGAAAEEKEVNQITAKTVEARSNRSFDIFHILATYSSEKYLLDILLPLKEELSKTVSREIINKATNCLQQVALGLTENMFISPEALLEFAYGVSTESIPALKARVIETDSKQLEYESRKNPDIYIIPEEPKQKKALMTSECSKTNAHLLVEFGLKLLYFLLKREKLKRETSLTMLNPLVKHLLECMDSQHVKVCSLAVQCLPWLARMKIPTMNPNLKPILTSLFKILHQFASAGLSKGDNFDLVMATFKTVGALVRDAKGWSISAEDRRILLLYCEQDIEDRERQATAFALLKALIARHVSADELNAVMKKVANISIVSPMDSVRLQARQVMLMYLMEYKLGEEVLSFLSFYLGQLGYTTKAGRESALEMVSTLVAAFPQDRLKDDCSLIFINVATRLINEEEADCKTKAGNLICQLLKKLDQNCRDKMFDVISAWISGKKVLHRQLGMQLAGLFASTEKEDFNRRLEPFLSLAMEEFRTGFGERKPGRFVLLHREEEEGEMTERLTDHLAFQTLQSVLKVLTVCPATLNDNIYKEYIDTIKEECHGLLAHEHEWVRTSAVQVLGLILTTTRGNVGKNLTLDLVSQLVSSAGEQLLKQCMKLLVYIADSVSQKKDDVNEEVSLPWLIKKVRQAVNRELIHTPTQHQIRMQYCRWAAALSLKLDRATLQTVAPELLVPVVKELGSETAELAEAAKQAAGYLKGKLGQSQYSEMVNRISITIQAKRAVRKTERAQLAVTDPERAAKRKINKQLKKKVLKKRKLELIKGHKFKKKPKRTEIEIGDG